MAQLSSEERVARVEQAPKEVQVMVAKAFLRDDIDDEDVQYLFNTDTLDELNDSEENSNVENVDAEEPEGIGALGFTMRTAKPSGNKNYMTTGTGGWSTCIKGYPNDPNANVLAKYINIYKSVYDFPTPCVTDKLEFILVFTGRGELCSPAGVQRTPLRISEI